jgi:predicted permease
MDRKSERHLEKELRFHMEQQVEAYVAAGMTRLEAERKVRLEFGGIEQVKEECREARGWFWLDQLSRDVRYGLRAMRRNPGFTSVVVLSLALGIGANTAIFSLLDTILLRTLPVAEPDRLLFLDTVGTGGPNGAPPYPCFERFRDQARSFTGMSALYAEDEKVMVDGQLEKVHNQYASGNYFDLLGVRPALGRLLNADDERLQPPVAVIGYAYWQRRFGGDRAVLGKVIRAEDRNITIVGVAAPGFAGLDPGRIADVTVPITLQPAETLHSSHAWFIEIVARLKPETTPARAQAEVNRIFQQFMIDVEGPANSARSSHRKYFDHMEVFPASKGMDRLRSQFQRPLLIVMGIVALVLLIGCANVGNLLMARSAARRQEFAVRLALGAGRSRLVRQLMTETMLLFFSGAVLSLFMARWAARSIAGYLAVGRSPLIVESSLDLRVLAFAAGLALLTGLLFGLWPALRASSLPEAGGRASASRSRSRARQVLVVSQVALSVVLLVGAGLFIRTLGNLKSLNLGFQAGGLITLSLEPAADNWAEILDQVRNLPGIQAATLSVMTPLSGRNRGVGIMVPGFQPHDLEEDSSVVQNHVSDGYFETLGIPLLAGRTFSNHDRSNSARVVVLNETAARFYFANRNPLGVKVDFGKNPSTTERIYEVVGVVADTKHNSLRKPTPRLVYIPVSQPRDRLERLTLTARTLGNPAAFVPAIRGKMTAINSGVLVTEALTAQDYIDASLVQERLVSTLSSFFGGLALLLCAIGLYGILAHAVHERTHEIGIRMALGAPQNSVAWMVVRQSLALVAAGVAIGLPVALVAVRPVQALLYGLKPADPETAMLAIGVLSLIAAVASYLPMRRAVRIDPMIALRHE